MASKFMNWVDARFPATQLWNEHIGQYYAPKNFNVWYYFGSLAMLVYPLLYPLSGMHEGLFDLSGKIAVVTGAGANGGIGHTLALGFAHHGADIAVADIDAPALGRAVAYLAYTPERLVARDNRHAHRQGALVLFGVTAAYPASLDIEKGAVGIDIGQLKLAHLQGARRGLYDGTALHGASSAIFRAHA